MNKNKLVLLYTLLKELHMHLQIKLDMGKQTGGTQGHKWGCKLMECKKLLRTVKNLLTGL